MKKLLAVAVVMLAALTSSKLYAQDDYKKFSLGIGLEAALPVGNLSNAYSFGGGATIRATIGLDASSAFTITSGALAFAPKDLGGGYKLKTQVNIPIKAGYRYMLSDNFYAIGEAGVTIAKTYASNGSGGTVSASGSSFTYAPGIGLKLGGVDLSVRYEGYSGAGFIGGRLGFNF
ncbi:outer membrane beta-barrel protein [Mucilaginibacter pedocola]|uniref:Outer membrane protein beta-barrel domain-containing protein n=1 Tax=Mucilaginibacter pedocola TaxID=1792845 RepID=A0A1S9PHX2_9SPHI|nr:outer membrane beta-barrel protein [Mucilaginibacter pedocola]OOQ60551.1 hypothetical protein BC343_25000 [Mucilaginibacter pedocola]